MNPIVSPRSRERSHRPVLRVMGGAEEPRVQLPGGVDASEPRKPALRIVTGEGPRGTAPGEAAVLLVGADARRRAILRAELGATLPARTPFAEAHDVSAVLERARSSRMVILAGDLDDADAGSLMRLLGRRHPQLPVICVEEPMPAAAGVHG